MEEKGHVSEEQADDSLGLSKKKDEPNVAWPGDLHVILPSYGCFPREVFIASGLRRHPGGVPGSDSSQGHRTYARDYRLKAGCASHDIYSRHAGETE